MHASSPAKQKPVPQAPNQFPTPISNKPLTARNQTKLPPFLKNPHISLRHSIQGGREARSSSRPRTPHPTLPRPNTIPQTSIPLSIHPCPASPPTHPPSIHPSISAGQPTTHPSQFPVRTGHPDGPVPCIMMDGYLHTVRDARRCHPTHKGSKDPNSFFSTPSSSFFRLPNEPRKSPCHHSLRVAQQAGKARQGRQGRLAACSPGHVSRPPDLTRSTNPFCWVVGGR